MTLMPLQAVPVQRALLGHRGSRGCDGAEQSSNMRPLCLLPFDDAGAGQSSDQQPICWVPFEGDGAGPSYGWGNPDGGWPPFEDDGAEQSYGWGKQDSGWLMNPFEDAGAGQSFQPFPFVPFEG